MLKRNATDNALPRQPQPNRDKNPSNTAISAVLQHRIDARKSSARVVLPRFFRPLAEKIEQERMDQVNR